jgi:hypothetical protein
MEIFKAAVALHFVYWNFCKMQNAEVNPACVGKVVRRIVSVAIAILQLAVTIPNCMDVRAFCYVFCLFTLPCLCVCIFAGRNKKVETIGWILQILLLILMICWSV